LNGGFFFCIIWLMLTYYLFYFVIGLIFGSFANVCIYRIPNDKSVIRPPSSCPSCGERIKWFDNIPLLSFILLKGKCRGCRAQISLRYPLVELLCGIIFLLLAYRFAFEPVLFVYMLFALVLVIISFIDYDYKVIPDFLSAILLLSALSFSVFNYQLGFDFKSRALNSLIGAITASGSLYLLGYAGTKIFKKEAMGDGDVKLMAGVGALLGWQKSLQTLLLASVIGAAFGIYLISSGKINKKDYLPFGPFLSLAAFINFFLPEFWI